MVTEKSNGSLETLEAYEAVAPFYEEYSSKKASYLDAVERKVIGQIKVGQRLIDIGSGDGRRLAKIMKAVKLGEVIAVEPSPAMAKLCRQSTGATVYEGFAEDLTPADFGRFNVATALWNVFGHVPNSIKRLQGLKNIAELLEKDGILILDVNNRHNAITYGVMNVIARKIVDTFCFDEVRGDAVYDWKIGEKTFKSKGHLFTPEEIERLFSEAGFVVQERLSVNYMTGVISTSKYRGQLLYILKKK